MKMLSEVEFSAQIKIDEDKNEQKRERSKTFGMY